MASPKYPSGSTRVVVAGLLGRPDSGSSETLGSPPGRRRDATSHLDEHVLLISHVTVIREGEGAPELGHQRALAPGPPGLARESSACRGRPLGSQGQRSNRGEATGGHGHLDRPFPRRLLLPLSGPWQVVTATALGP